MPNILDLINQHRVLVADGAMGTMLIQRGLVPGDCPERMNLDHPEIIEEIARLYVESGAEIIQTNTFGASPLKLAAYHLDDKTEQINISAIRAARRGSQGRAFVAASVGSCGKLLTPYGDTAPDLIFSSFARQMAALIPEGVDMISIETMIDLSEAKLAIQAARSVSSSIPICASMTFDATPRGFFTIMGVTIEQAAKGLADSGANIVGSNCGNGIDNMVRIATEFRKYTVMPLSIRSNAGLPKMIDLLPVYPETPSYMAEKSIDLARAGADIIGGCCGTTPEHMAAIKQAISLQFKR